MWRNKGFENDSFGNAVDACGFLLGGETSCQLFKERSERSGIGYRPHRSRIVHKSALHKSRHQLEGIDEIKLGPKFMRLGGAVFEIIGIKRAITLLALASSSSSYTKVP